MAENIVKVVVLPKSETDVKQLPEKTQIQSADDGTGASDPVSKASLLPMDEVVCPNLPQPSFAPCCGAETISSERLLPTMVNQTPPALCNSVTLLEAQTKRIVLSSISTFGVKRTDAILGSLNFDGSNSHSDELSHVLFEFEMFLYSSTIICDNYPRDDNSQSNALFADGEEKKQLNFLVCLESNRLHLRNLIEFFDGKVHSSSFHCSDIVNDPIPFQFEKEQNDKLCKAFNNLGIIYKNGPLLTESGVEAVYSLLCELTDHLSDSRTRDIKTMQELIYSCGTYSLVVNAIVAFLEAVKNGHFAKSFSITDKTKILYSQKSTELLKWLSQ